MATLRSSAALLLPIALFGTACFGGEHAFPNSDDFRMSHSESEERAGSLAEYGDVYALGMQSAHEVNGWVGEGVDVAGRIIRTLEKYPPTSTDGSWDVYGPYRDTETGLSWRIRISGDEDGSNFEVAVGSDGKDMRNLLTGSVDIDGDLRYGTFSMDFDVVEEFELKAGPDKDRTYTGRIDIRFERSTETDRKIVEIDYDNFEVTQEYPIVEYFSAESYAFRKNDEGAGSFHLDIMSTFQAQVWSGPERERMTIDLEWNETGAGVGAARMLQLEGEGDLAYGDIHLDECFDEHGYFTWRQLNEPYAGAYAEYNSGDPALCPELDDAELPEFTRG
jgi:hypothetical protein